MLTRTSTIGHGPFTVFAYEQRIDGIPVEGSAARVVTRRSARGAAVVHAAGWLIQRPAQGFVPVRFSGPEAVRIVQQDAAYTPLTIWSGPELVVLDDPNTIAADPILAWSFSGRTASLESFEAYTFFVEAASGRLIHVRDEVYHAAVTGSVTGLATPGLFPDVPTNPALSMPLPNLTVSDEFDAAAETDAAGEFVLNSGAVGPVEINAALSGPWVTVRSQANADLSVAQTVTAPADMEILFNPKPSEFDTAQVNGFIHANGTHDFYSQRQPGFAALDTSLLCAVNINDQCNAFFTPVPQSINFFRAQNCVNTAYSTVITHEYGHFIVNRLELRQASFGEGFSDVLSAMIFDDPVVGRDFLGPGTVVRDTVAANQQYPCFGEIHECGQVVSGVWWDLKLNLQSSQGVAGGLELARQLFTDWSQMTVGVARGRNSATPLTAVEVISVDDDDANLANGTPHYDEICDAFAAHSIPCPGACGSIERLRVSCRDRSLSIHATAITVGGAGGEVVLTLDGSHAQSANVTALGRASTTFGDVAAGDHEVCIEGCDICRTVTCGG
ncbi:MAG: hypothetical protein AABZ12_00145 [Planctomycetota bacterium]